MKIGLEQHAVDRFRERSGIKTEARAMAKLLEYADQAVRVGPDRFFARGWILIIRDGFVKTVYRPDKAQMALLKLKALYYNAK